MNVDTFDTLPLSKYKIIRYSKKIKDKFLLYLLRYLDIKIYYNVFRRKFIKRFYKNVILTIISLLYLLKITILIPKFLFIESKTYYFFDTIDEIKRYSLFNHFRFADRSYVISKCYQKKLTNHLI